VEGLEIRRLVSNHRHCCGFLCSTGAERSVESIIKTTADAILVRPGLKP
jgi:hypothetical protein